LQSIISVIDSCNSGADGDEDKALNEIRYIMGRIMDTINFNNQLKQEMEQALLRLNNAQAAALQAQIKPHFLYNTLEAIKWMAMDLTMNKENAVSGAITSLGELLCLSMDMGGHLTKIDSEIYNLKLYVDLLKLRYEDKFSVEWDVDDGLTGYKTIKLSLQPLVENALYHGIKKKAGNGVIKISCFSEGNDIVFKVSDDGVGMPDETVRRLNGEINGGDSLKPKNIGLININGRIKILFGQSYGIKIESAENIGTTVTMTIAKVN
jgi:two-component system sensor histidine kinase YesM